MAQGTPRQSIQHSGRHRFASILETAEYLGVNHKLVRKMLAEGRVYGYRLPGSKLIRIDLDELDATLRANTLGGAA